MSESYEKMLAEKRANVWEQAKALLDHAAEEKRELDAEERKQYDEMNADLDSQRQAIDKLAETRKAHAQSEEALRALADIKPTEDRKSQGPSAAEQLRAVCRSAPGIGGVEFTPASDRRDGLNEVRALSKLTAAAGGNTVPTSFYGKLWAHLIQTANLINAGATVWTTDSGESIQVPITTAHSTAALVAEAATIGQSDPTFGQRAVGSYKYGLLIKLSTELLADTGVDIEGYVAMEAGRAVGNALGTDLVTGTAGGVKPDGILNATTLGVTSGTAVVGVPTWDNLFDLFYSVIPQYRSSPEAAWLFNDATVGVIRKLKDGQNRYLWEPSLTAGAPDTILTKPVFTDPNIPLTGLNNKSVIFGDISRYLVRMVNGVRFERSVDFAFDQDLVTLRCLVRADGLLVDRTGAVKHFVGAAS